MVQILFVHGRSESIAPLPAFHGQGPISSKTSLDYVRVFCLRMVHPGVVADQVAQVLQHWGPYLGP